MKILLIDSNQSYLEEACKSLSGHDVTFCSSHDEAIELVWERDEWGKIVNCHNDAFRKDLIAKFKAKYWDVVFCNLLMPIASECVATYHSSFTGQTMQVGWQLAFMAITLGAKYVIVFADRSPNDHPAIDMLSYNNGNVYTINDTKLLLINRWIKYTGGILVDWKVILDFITSKNKQVS